jgi:tellurite resistance protein TerA
VRLAKLTLDKPGQSAKVSLAKGPGVVQEMVINLNWTQPRGFFASKIDLDLGVFYELHNGEKSCIDGINFSKGRGGPRNIRTRQGCLTGPPWVWHAGDDRTGSNAAGENIYVNPAGLGDVKRLFVYAFIYEGAARWSETDAVVTIKAPGNEITIQMGQQSDRRTFCALADIRFQGSSDMDIRKCVTFHGDHEECDNAYGWGLRWRAGGKD